MQLPFLVIPLVTIPCHLPILSSLASPLALSLLHSEFFVLFPFQLALFLSSNAAVRVESQQSSNDFLGFKQITADHHPLSTSLNGAPRHF